VRDGRDRLKAWRTVVLALVPVLVAAALFLSRAGRPLEQGGDAYSDGDVVVAGRNFHELGFARLHFLPVLVPEPTRPAPARDEYYTHYPPVPYLLNGLFRHRGLADLRGWRLISAAVSLAGLLFWFLALRALFDESVAAIGVAAYALNFSFIWLGDSIHDYGYADFLRLVAFYLGVQVARPVHRRVETAALATVLFIQSLVGFDYIPFSHAALIGLGATGFRGERLRRLALFALMPALGVGLHLLQNAWTLGLSASVADLAGAAAERSLARHFTVAALARHVIWDAGHFMGIGLGTIAGFGAFGATAWAQLAPPSARGLGARVLITVAVASSLWYVLMSQHATEHPYENRQLLPLASLALSLGLRGLYGLVAPYSARLALAGSTLVAMGLVADGSIAYWNDANQRSRVSEEFAVAYAQGAALPRGVTVVTNIPAPSPPALAALVDRRVRLARSISELEAGGHSGDTVVYLYSASCPVGDDLVDLFRRAKTIKLDATGATVELTIP
jgi:hypothetical protein